MKRVSILILLVLAYLEINAQDYSKWNVGLNITSGLYGAILLAPSVNYDLGNKFEVSVTPIFMQDKTTYSNGDTRKQQSWGGNFSGKYYLSKENIMDPYATLLVGFGQTSVESTLNSFDNSYFNIAILLGNELQIGKNGWNFDFNIGVLSIKVHYRDNLEYAPFFSVGVKKRFLKM